MSEPENELLDAQLARLKPAKLPADFRARLEAAIPRQETELATREPQLRGSPWSRWLIWLAPAAASAAVVVGLLVWRLSTPAQTEAQGPSNAGRGAPALKADAVDFDRQLVSAFDAVAQLPDGLPVRFHCREWSDDVTWRDSVKGIVIEQRKPRLEIVPVRFETY